MSDLQIVLIVIGGIIIAGVLIFNWWQERKFHQQIERNFSDFQQETPVNELVAENIIPVETSTTQEQPPENEEQDFTIDPYRFKDEDTSLEPATYTGSQAMGHDNAAEIEPEMTETEDAAIRHGHAESPEESELGGNSAKHENIKVIIQNAFESTQSAKISASEQIESHQDSQQNAPADTAPTVVAAETVTSQLPEMLNSQVDWAALLYLQGVASVQDVLASLKDGFSNYDKPVFIHVKTAQGWQLLAEIADKAEFAVEPVTKVCCSIQLADRAGAISRGGLNRFQLAVESLGLDINAHVEWQNSGDSLNDANALDQFCIEVDKTMGFHLLHGENGAFTGTKLRGLAEAQGLQLANDGTFKFVDESSGAAFTEPHFVMFNRDHYPFSPEMLRSAVVKSVTFQLDIPHVKNCVEAFNTMVQVAKQMETGLNAQLVDDNNRRLTDAQIEKIRHQLKIIQATMLTRGIVPGSDCARRLFS